MDAEGLLQMGLTAAAGIVLLYSIARGAPQQAPGKDQSSSASRTSPPVTGDQVQDDNHKAKAHETPQKSRHDANDSTIAREMHVPDDTPSWMSRREASFVTEFAEKDLHPTWMGAPTEPVQAAEFEPSWLSHREPSFVGNPFEAEMQPSWMSKQAPAAAAPTPIRKSDVHMNGHHTQHDSPSEETTERTPQEHGFVMDEKEQDGDEHGAIEASWMSARDAHVIPGREAEFSWMTRKDPVPSSKAPSAYRVPARSHAQHRVVVSTNDVVSHVARDHCDMVFVYPVASAGFLGETLKAEAKAHPKCAVQFVETRTGAGRVVVGAASSHKQRVSVLCSSRSLRPMIPAILDLAEKRLPVTFHVALSAISDEDVSSKVDHSDLAAIRDIDGATIFFSAGPQDTYETAVAAHWTAAKLSGPVFHVFDSTGRLNRIADIELTLKNASAPHVQPHVAAEDSGRAASKVLRSLKKAPFEYTGNAHARVVLVGMGSAAQVAERHVTSHKGSSTGALKVRMLRPWSGEELLRVVPNSALRVCVLDQSSSDALFSIVAATFAADASRRHVQVSYVRVPPSFRGVTYDLVSRALEELLLSNDERLVLAAPGKKAVDGKAKASVKSLCVFVSAKHAHGAFVAGKEAAVHALKDHVRFSSYTDDFAGDSGGVSLMELRLGAGPELSHIEGPLDASEAQVVVVADEEVLSASQIDLFGPLCEGGVFLVPAKANLSLTLKRRASAKHAHIVHLSGDAAQSLEGWASVAAGLAALSKADLDHVLTPILSAFRAGHHDSMDWTLLNDACRRLEREAETVAHRVGSLHADAPQNGHEMPHHAHSNGHGHFPRRLGDLFTHAGDSGSYMNGGSSADASHLSDVVSTTSYSPIAVDSSVFGLIPRAAFKKHHQHRAADDSVLEVVRPHEVAWNVVFKEAYETGAALRPREHETHKVRLVCRKRLTPLTYERNIFHLEFDISGTDLKYEIGDALGVFGHNDEEEVDDFIARYNATGGNIDPDAFIAFKNTEKHAGKSELVSVRNLLLQHLDLFGRPSKKFYVWLAEHAKSRYEKLKLNHTGTDDSEAFKLSVNETLTFADILLQHPSARPSVEQLAGVIPAIKARHYSIASSMRYTPRSVALLVVAVDWKTPGGRVRYGQCTRYLATLNPEQDGGCFVTVDVVPSVLRLPPRPEQPIVMAGLGTGMAPFRAFVQERKVQKESGLKVGPIVLYFGARHRSEEWLYGEEWDQYQREGLVTRLGLAFSRDQKEKIYIQHRIKEDATLLKELFMDQEGYFYLCGPTWPVPDVRDAVAMGLDPENAKKGNTDIVERLKDEGRYILEVY